MSSRRTVLAGLAVALAGCLGDDGDSSEPADDDEDRYVGPQLGDTELHSAFPLSLDDPADEETVVEVHYHGDGEAGWHYAPLELSSGEERRLTMHLYDEDHEPIALSDGYVVSPVPPSENEDVVAAAVEGDELTVTGEQEGETELRLEVEGPDGATWTTPPLRVVVAA